MNKLNDTNIFYKNALNKMSEENIDDIKITVCIYFVFFYILYIFLYFIVVIKTYFIHTVHARKRKFV